MTDAHGWTPQILVDLRSRPNRRRAALVVAALVGLTAAWIHWLGLVVAGALVGLVSETLPRAAAAGLAIGVLVVVVHVAASPIVTPAGFFGLAPASYVTIGLGLIAPLWGSLLRGVL